MGRKYMCTFPHVISYYISY